MIILFIVFHTIIKDPYGTYLAFSKKNIHNFWAHFWEAHNGSALPKPYWIRLWVGHNSLSKLKEHKVKGVLLKRLF